MDNELRIAVISCICLALLITSLEFLREDQLRPMKSFCKNKGFNTFYDSQIYDLWDGYTFVNITCNTGSNYEYFIINYTKEMAIL